LNPLTLLNSNPFGEIEKYEESHQEEEIDDDDESCHDDDAMPNEPILISPSSPFFLYGRHDNMAEMQRNSENREEKDSYMNLAEYVREMLKRGIDPFQQVFANPKTNEQFRLSRRILFQDVCDRYQYIKYLGQGAYVHGRKEER